LLLHILCDILFYVKLYNNFHKITLFILKFLFTYHYYFKLWRQKWKNTQ